MPRASEYRDKGCKISPKGCQECPLPPDSCVLINKARAKLERAKIKRTRRDARIIKLKKGGKRTGQIAQLTGLSIRSVQRIIQKGG